MVPARRWTPSGVLFALLLFAWFLAPVGFARGAPQAGPPASLSLSPVSETNRVGTDATITATVRDSSNDPVQGALVNFHITGANPNDPEGLTDANGQASDTYTGQNAGHDSILAFVDNDADGQPSPGDPQANASKDWVLEADLSIAKTAPATGQVGGTITYHLAVHNAGPDVSSGATVTDSLPAGTTLVSATPSQGSCSGTSKVSCALGAVATGGNASVDVAVTLSQYGNVTNTAQAAASETDPTSSNNSSSATTAVSPAGDCTIVGTEDDDTINGTAGNDVMCGLGGNDTINGLGGDDVIYGGAGDDLLSGGLGVNTVYGEPGNDSISLGDDDGDGGECCRGKAYGGDGDDSITGDLGPNLIDGGAGADTVDARAGNDSVLGGLGINALHGGPGDDAITVGDCDPETDPDCGGGGTCCKGLVFGDEGNDTITGDAGPNRLDGGPGDDTIDGGAGRDELYGGLGNDVLNQAADCEVGTVGCGGDTCCIGQTFGEEGDDTITGSNFAELIEGGPGDDTIDGGDGNDQILGGLGINAIHGGPGDDTITAGECDPDDKNCVGGSCCEGLAYGDEGNDTITGDAAPNLLVGGPGADTIDGGPGADELHGGLGNDIISQGDAECDPEDKDCVVGTCCRGKTFGEKGDDELTGSGFGEFINGGPGKDTIHGSAGNDKILGGSADDSLYGGLGDDVISQGDDECQGCGCGDGGCCCYGLTDGGAGNDRITGSLNGEKILGGLGNDKLTSFGGPDIVVGGAGTDILRGGLGDDLLRGRDGADVLDGGAGADVCIGGPGQDSEQHCEKSSMRTWLAAACPSRLSAWADVFLGRYS